MITCVNGAFDRGKNGIPVFLRHSGNIGVRTGAVEIDTSQGSYDPENIFEARSAPKVFKPTCMILRAAEVTCIGEPV